MHLDGRMNGCLSTFLQMFFEGITRSSFFQLFSKYFWGQQSGPPKNIWRKVEDNALLFNFSSNILAVSLDYGTIHPKVSEQHHCSQIISGGNNRIV
jgi:hypothetical protein